jgi:hypothetical protein
MCTQLTVSVLLGLVLAAPAAAQSWRQREPRPYPVYPEPYRETIPRYPDRYRQPYPREEPPNAWRDGREVWRYESFEWGGTFERGRGGNWVQNRNNMGPAYFREVGRNGEFVELYDDSRGMAVRLYPDAMYYNPDGRRWRGPHPGYWESDGRFRP